MRELHEFTMTERARINEIGDIYTDLSADDVALLIEWNSSAAAAKARSEQVDNEIADGVKAIGDYWRSKRTKAGNDE